MFGRQLRKRAVDLRDEVGGRIRRDGTGRDHGYPGGRARPPPVDPDGERALWVGTDGTWRWRHRIGDTYHHRFWGQIARWAADNKAAAGNDLIITRTFRAPIDDVWTSVIEATRRNFPGKLIYSANWDHYDTPQFWHLLDYIGVSSYFEVSRREAEPIFRITQRWRQHRDDLVQFARKTAKPVILTEVGYPSVDSAAVRPWDYTARSNPNPNAQLAAFRSLAVTWTLDDPTASGFAGLFIWHGWGHGGAEDVSYPIWGKSSERLIRTWYGSSLVLP